MLKELSTMLGFTFNIHDNPEGKYGQNNGGTWNGMIGEVVPLPFLFLFLFIRISLSLFQSGDPWYSRHCPGRYDHYFEEVKLDLSSFY